MPSPQKRHPATATLYISCALLLGASSTLRHWAIPCPGSTYICSLSHHQHLLLPGLQGIAVLVDAYILSQVESVIKPSRHNENSGPQILKVLGSTFVASRSYIMVLHTTDAEQFAALMVIFTGGLNVAIYRPYVEWFTNVEWRYFGSLIGYTSLTMILMIASLRIVSFPQDFFVKE